ncbi:glycosyltransferase family 2 protein [Nitrosomonas sp. Nm166]|uniref:glycosyltransferase family 2 protein n=1 Tax=Nitrosomonas sp. Nm166 TaxID=1881054 RepID=UPI0008E4C6CA|nr:glycosyltransferase family 2 protein [Nitrosomonas sp. Nm166]SFE72912.1 Glycosyltransferase, GT2 family [Nitrosomonas sp. Nm166]
MDESASPSIDVIIPVYNAPEQTGRCIDSVIAHLGQLIGTIYIQDDASGAETRAMLNRLPYQQIHIYHAPQNQGYGKSVNEAVARSNADLVLVLNSDTEICENFLPLLCRALADDPELAVISPAHDNFFKCEADRYQRQSGGYIATYRFKGYAFLIRRNLFVAMGGFDTQFGRGYFEDIDLGRRLDQQGWHMGVHPDTHIHHEGGASFGRGRAYRALVQRNRALYLSRYPEARQNILLISGQYTLADLPAQLADAIEHVLRQGGGIYWLTPLPLSRLSCLQMRNSPASVKMIMRLMLRGWFREDKRITGVWILPGVSGLLRTLLAFFVHMRKLQVQKWNSVA